MSKIRQAATGRLAMKVPSAIMAVLLAAVVGYGCLPERYDLRYPQPLKLDGVDEIIVAYNREAYTDAERGVVLYYDRTAQTLELITAVPSFYRQDLVGMLWDYDNDGDQDLIVTGTTGETSRESEVDFYKVENLGNNEFANRADYLASIPNFSGEVKLYSEDYTGDGINDLVFSSSRGQTNEERRFVFGIKQDGKGNFNGCTDFIYTFRPNAFQEENYYQGDCYIAKHSKGRV